MDESWTMFLTIVASAVIGFVIGMVVERNRYKK